MNTLEIEAALCSNPITSPFYIGTFAADRLPRFLVSRPSILVVNSDKAGYPGFHWLGFVLNNDKCKTIEFFDTFGRKPCISTYQSFIKRNGGLCIYNDKQVQSVESDTCGMFVCVFLLYRCKGYTFKKIREMFSNTPSDNEKLIRSIFKHHFKSRAQQPTLEWASLQQ